MLKTKEKQRAILTNWKVVDIMGAYRLTGTVTQHPLIAAGEEIRTSSLVRIDFKRCVAETLNTLYELL